MEKLREEQRKRHEELYGIPASGIPGEDDSDEEGDLGEPQLVADTGDTSADGDDILGADETMGSADLGGGDIDLGGGSDDLLG